MDYVNAGVQVNVVVEGQLSMLAMTNQGFQIGLAAFDLEFGRDSTRVNQWVSMHALKPA